MASKRLLEAKQFYEDYIVYYMYEHHISFKTLEETKESWRTERPYNANIEKELIEKSITFLNTLPNEVNLDFRKSVAYHMAEYLSEYIAKNPGYAKYKNGAQKRATSTLKDRFVEHAEKQEERKKAKKARKVAKNTAHKSVKIQVLRESCMYNTGTGSIEIRTIKTTIYSGRRYPYDTMAKIAAAQRKHNAHVAELSTRTRKP